MIGRDWDSNLVSWDHCLYCDAFACHCIFFPKKKTASRGTKPIKPRYLVQHGYDTTQILGYGYFFF